jgi:flagellar protein FlaF
MMSNGYTVYNSAQSKTVDARDIEYSLLAQVTSALIQAREKPEDLKGRLEAALWNRNVWSALRIDLLSEENQLPKQLRASLISVSLWIEKECMSIMRNDTQDMESLISINRNIMAGLKPEFAQDDVAEQQAKL